MIKAHSEMKKKKMLLISQGHSTFQNELSFTIFQNFFASFTKLAKVPLLWNLL